jgi:hypothetical protein
MFRTNILRKAFLLGKLFNNVFIEIVRDTDNNTKSLNVLDSLNIDPITEPNGDPIKFKSKIPNAKTGEYPFWDKKDIVWMKFGDRSIGFAPVDLRALWENLVAKDYMKRFVSWLWQTGQYRILYNIQNASDKDIEDFLAYARKNDDNFRSPFLIKGELKNTLLRDMKETDSLVELFKYYDSQTLILLRVPPNDVGIPDASGRSNADAQSNNLSTSITSMKTVVEDFVNFDLFPKMNKGNNLMRFSPIDRFAVKQLIENVNIMKNIGMTEKVIKEYLNDNGMFFSSNKLFDDPMEQAQKMNEMAMKSVPKKDIDTMDSRLNRSVKPGEKPTTREDQLKKV